MISINMSISDDMDKITRNKICDRTKFISNDSMQMTCRACMAAKISGNMLKQMHTTNMCNHACQQSIGCDVKWHPKTHISRTLIHLAR